MVVVADTDWRPQLHQPDQQLGTHIQLTTTSPTMRVDENWVQLNDVTTKVVTSSTFSNSSDPSFTDDPSGDFNVRRRISFMHS